MNSVDNDETILSHDWQSSKKKLTQRVDHVFNSDMLSDVQFLVGQDSSKQRIPAHKFVLSVGSSVFCAMFYGELAMNSQEIEIPDIEPEAFLALLKFLYADTIVLSSDTVISTMYASKKYAVPALEKECSKFLQSCVTHDTAFTLLTHARLFNDNELESKCLHIIDENPNVFKSTDFIDIDLDLFCSIICRENLMMREIELFHAAIKWSEAECKRKKIPITTNNQKIVLGPAIKLIRFPLMTIDEFSDDVIESGLLADKEVILIMRCITAKQKPSTEFSCTPRKMQFSVCRFSIDKPITLFVPNAWFHKIGFIVDCPIIICGFNVYNLPIDKGRKTRKSSVLIELRDIKLNLIGEIKGLLKSDNSTTSTISEVRFQNRILLQKNHKYLVDFQWTIIEQSRPCRDFLMYSGIHGQSKVSVELPQGKITFEFLSDDTIKEEYFNNYNCGLNEYRTTVESGQIPQIIFKLP